MNQKEMNKLLYDAVKKYEPGADDRFLKKVERQSVYDVINQNKYSYRRFRDLLITLGKILEENEDKKTYITVIYSGIANMNPCIVVIYVDNDKVIINAFAREGLINQHTANKVVNLIRKKI